MQNFDIASLLYTVNLHGALDIDQRKKGISPRRLPDWTRKQVPQMMDVMVRMPSGVRMIFNTDATDIEITALATNLVTPPAEKRPVTFDLDYGNQVASDSHAEGNTIVLDRKDRGKFELQRGQAETWRFKLPEGDKRCELWLPHNAFVELQTLSINDGATVQPPTQENRPLWVHYGSSISHCMEADQPTGIWPAVAAREAGICLQNLGFGGQCHLDQFVARTIRDLPADLISIKTGINIVNMDSMRERIFVPALHGFLDTIREQQPGTPITLISPIYCPAAETHPGPTIPNQQGKFVTLPGHEEIRDGCMTLTRIRELIQSVVETREDANLFYFDGLELFGEEDAGDLPDDLHPNPEGYRRMGKRYAARHLNQLATQLK